MSYKTDIKIAQESLLLPVSEVPVFQLKITKMRKILTQYNYISPTVTSLYFINQIIHLRRKSK
jgi:hypothetical protein